MFERIKQKIRVILKLALPMMTSFVAIGLMGVVDTIIVGRYNTEQLAYMGIANSIFVILFTIPIALLQGVMIKASQKFGAGKFQSTGKIYNEGKKYLVILTIFFMTIGLSGPFILELFGQTEEMAVQGGKLLIVLSCSIPFILINVNDNFFLQSIKRPHIPMYSSIIANVLNIIINPVLVYGLFGAPELGALGAVYTTVFLRVFMAAFSRIYISNMKKNPKINKRFGLDRKYDTWWSDSKTTRKIGYGTAVTTVAVNGSFSMVTNFAGWMGEQIMSTFVIIMTTGGIMFMLFFSLSQATSIIVANDYGKKDKEGIVASTISGFIMMLGAILVFVSLYVIFFEQIFSVFTKDTEVISMAVSLTAFIVLEIVTDSLPLPIVASLNGRSDVKIPTIFQVISFLGVRIAACYILAFRFDMGLKGLILGLCFGGLTSTILNIYRFIYLTKRDKAEGIK